MSDLFLTEAELKILTGRAWPSKQAEWLRANAIPFRLNAAQRPIVTRAAVVQNESANIPATKSIWSPAVITR